jgi:acetyl-CoA/propionyl-CoA carboxylase biotin carboxyl carrier protein
MKMENEIAAPHAGTIGEVRARPGMTVQVGDTLLTFAP